MHLDAEQVQRVLHGEPVAISAREHLAMCANCRDLVAAAGSDEAAVHALLRVLDDVPPGVTVADIVARACAGMHAWGRRAAILALGLGVAGAAWALPGSPLPRWVAAAVERVRGSGAGERGASRTEESPAATSGVAMSPATVRVIEFGGAPPEAIDVRLTDGDLVEVRAPAGSATFTAEGARLIVRMTARGAVTIAVPRAAPRLEVRAAGRRLLLKEGARVVAEGAVDANGRYLLDPSPDD